VAQNEKARDYFRCTACHQRITIDPAVAPDAKIRCPQCYKTVGRIDSVCSEVVDATNTLSSQMLRYTFDRLMEADKEPE
jgi:transcription initiation factor IIE alpha subunit